MRSQIIVLLAVCSNVAVAGVLRRNVARAQHHNAARFLNHTEIPLTPTDIQTSTTISISSSLIIPSMAASTQTYFAPTSSTAPTATPLTPNVVSSSSLATALPTTSTLSQDLLTSETLPTTLSTAAGSGTSQAESGLTPSSTEVAVSQPAETASRFFSLAGNPSSDLQPSTNAQSFSSMLSPISSVSLTPTFEISSATNIRNAVATPLSPSHVNQAPSLFAESVNASAKAGTSRVMPYSTTSVPSLSSDTASQNPSAVVIPVPISSGLIQISAPSGGATLEFAPVTLDPSSPAPTGTAKYPTAANGNSAMAAGFNSVYKTLTTDSPCNPSDPSQAYVCIDGETAECQSDGTYVLKSCPSLQSCYALPKASGSTGVVVQCAVPSDAHSMLAGLSSSTAGPLAVTSQPAQTLQVEGGLSQATLSVSAQNAVQSVTSSRLAQATIQSQTLAPTPTIFAVTATSSQDQNTDQGDEAAGSTRTSSTSTQSVIQHQSPSSKSPVLAVTATAQQVHDSDPLNKSPTSSTSSSTSSTAAPVESVPNALFAVVTAGDSDQASSSQTGQQSSLPDSDSLPVTAASVTSTSTSRANDAGNILAPTEVPVNQKVAVGNGQATVTVTVTVTTTERPAPITISAS